MSTKTSNYQLHQWEPNDQFLREDFNSDFAKIDAGIKNAYNHAGEVESNLSAQLTSAKNVLNTAIGKKADQSALTALQNTVNTKATTAALNSLQTVVAGKCEVVIGTYTGNGATAQTIYLGFTPKAVLVEGNNGRRPDNMFYGGLVLPNYPSEKGDLSIVTNGFQVKSTSGDLNAANRVKFYIAFK